MQFDAGQVSTGLTVGLIGLAGLLALWFLLAYCRAGPSMAKSLVKTASVGLLALVAAREGPLLLALALGLGALGDFALSRTAERALIAGMAAFGAAHLVYLLMLADLGQGWPPIGLGLGLLGFSAVMASRLWSRAGALRGPVMAYVGVIAAMGLFALRLPAEHMVLVGAALLFIASDALLSEDLFGEGPEPAWRAYAVWSLYWLAQLLFLLGFS